MRHLTPLPPPARSARGLTLVELMVALAIAAMLAVAAAPSFTEYMANSRLRENGNSLYAQTLYAQSEAIKRNTVVRVAVADGSIIVSDRTDPDDPQTIKTTPLTNGIAAEAFTLDFGGEGRPVGFATAEVDFSHPSLTCSSTIRCPGLRVDAGGGVRLCGDHTGSCE
ncbi:MAG: GspH/FimT family pseudopilin [Burkholderiaceae bacterium]|nr:GspH/FimT family pseudopilin [Burkholderiaceae bacterium]